MGQTCCSEGNQYQFAYDAKYLTPISMSNSKYIPCAEPRITNSKVL